MSCRLAAFTLRTLAENLLDWRQCASRFVIQPAIYLLAFGAILSGALGKPAGSAGYASVVAPGVLCIIVMNAALGAVSGIFLRGYYSRTMETWLQTPLSPRDLLIALLAGCVLTGTLAGVIGIALVWGILGLLPAAPLLTIAILAAASLGLALLFTAIFAIVRTPDKAQDLLSLTVAPMTFLGCTFYDYATLAPPWSAIALLLPTTYISEALRAAYSGGDAIAGIPDHFRLGTVLVMAVLLVGADRLFQRRFGDFPW